MDPDFFHTNIKFRGGANNVRYDALLPLLPRVKSRYLYCSGPRPLRSAQFLTLQALSPVVMKQVVRRFGRGFPYAFVTNHRYLPFVDVPCCVDMDDPVFSDEELQLLSRSNVRLVVVPSTSILENYSRMGLRTTMAVIGQGTHVTQITGSESRPAGPTMERDHFNLVYAAPLLDLTSSADDGMAVYDLSVLVNDIWPQVHALVPQARLHLIGDASNRLERRIGSLQGIVLVGRMRPSEVSGMYKQMDVGLYPRQVDHVRQSIKVIDMLACGLPIVAFDFPPAEPIRESGGGWVVGSIDEFVRTIVHAARHRTDRLDAGKRASRWGEDRAWAKLADRYSALLTEHFPESHT